MRKLKKRALGSKWIQRFLYVCIRLYAWSFRVTVENEEEWKTHVHNGGRVLLCTWHQQFFSAIRYFKNYESYQPSLMISQSSDGDIIAGIARLSGWHPVRGSSSKDGRKALREMIMRLKAYGLAAHILDGPRGPIGKVKAGAIQLALLGDAVIVPFYASADRAWFFNSWDRFFIPKPFARVHLRFGAPVHLVRSKSATDFENQRKQLEDMMAIELRGV